MLLAACGRGDRNLWDMRFEKPRITRMEITGYWEGEVFSGGIRVAIAPAQITVAMKCDSDGKKLAQASAPIVFDHEATARMVLQQDLAGGDADCGFRFNQGDAFGYGIDRQGVLQIAFGNASVSRLAKLSDLAVPK